MSYRTPAETRDRARRCRWLADHAPDPATAAALRELAEQLEAEALLDAQVPRDPEGPRHPSA